MHKKTISKTLPAQTHPLPSTAGIGARKPDPNWKPQPCGLSREELRKIVAEIMG